MARDPQPGDQQPQEYQRQRRPQPYQPQPGYEAQPGYYQQPGHYQQQSGDQPAPGYPQPGAYPSPMPQPERRKRGGLATASLVLGIIGLVLAVIPFANFVAYPLVVLAIIFGAVASQWGKAKAGLVLGIVGLIATIVWSVAIGKVFDDAVNKPHTVVYTVSGSIGKADISYYSSDSSNNDKQVSTDNEPLPWSKTIRVKGDLSFFDVTANSPFSLHAKRGTLSCTLSVDGEIVSRDTASGDGNFVSCDGTGYSGD